ncbi:MAG TPA: peptidylprolyl isomerase [Niabella sp.]|jgi:peptidyl-prolyl cis-trans isomerase D|nr:peptidylprolyl isomerase [Chitinophagaceae bacterium]HRO83722.1 peptidylprolyl isomerase [Niabella sp.]
MSVIQKIQDKYGKVMAVIIGISLVIFVVMLAFENGGNLFKGNSMTVGKINGQTVDYLDFQALTETQSRMLEGRGITGEALNQQANDAAWNQEIARVLLTQETDKLGLGIGKKELNDLLFGANPPQDLAQGFTNPQTGHYDAAAAQQQINMIKNQGTPEQKAQLNEYLDQVVFQHLAQKYDALMVNSINFPKWMIEKQNADNNQISKISFVREPYSSISDSSVKVSVSDIKKYIDKHANDFKQEESRSIAYLAFSAAPTATDTAAALQKILELKQGLDSVKDVKDYLVRQGVNTYYDSYISGNRIQVPMKDSIFRVGVGNVYGPYIDGNTFTLAKLVGSRTIPDTVKIRHILIATVQQDPQSGQSIPIRDTATAKHLADSIALAIRNGSNFDSLVVKFSNDPGSVENGGVYDNVPSGQMVPEFNDFIFEHPTGSKGVVKTSFGYHYIEILSQKGSSTGYKIAYLSRPIDASQETDMAANNAATLFAGRATNSKSFEKEAEIFQKEKGINKVIATDIPPMGYTIQGLGNSRSLVRSLYKADLGDVLQPERVGDAYVVALVTEVNKEGTMSPEKARMMVEPLLINEKKADIIKSKLGKITTLEAAASALKKTVETADSISFLRGSQVFGFEPKVVGASFNKANVNKVIPEAIAGAQGVYVVKVDNITSLPAVNTNVEEERKMRYQQAKQQSAFQSIQLLKEGAKIKDYRSKFF